MRQRTAPLRRRTGHAVDWLLTPGPFFALICAASVIALLGPSLLGKSVLAPEDATWFDPPFAGERPAALHRPSNKKLVDVTEVFHPDLYKAREEIRSGRLPLWDPNVGAGRPLLASQQSAPLFPIHGLAYMVPFWHSLAWIAALKLLLAALGMFLFCRSLGLHSAASALGGVAFGFSTALLGFLEHPQVNVFSLLPWGLLCVQRVLASAKARDGLFLAAVTGAMAFGGHPESLMFATATMAGYAAWRALTDLREIAQRARRFGLVGGGIGVGLLCGAIALVPFVELVHQSGSLSSQSRNLGSSSIRNVGYGLFLPNALGRVDRTNFAPEDADFFAHAFYVGAIPFLVGLAGATVRRPNPTWFFGGLGLVCLLVFLDAPFIGAAFHHMPLLSLASAHNLIFLIAFCLAVVGAVGLHVALAASPAERRRMVFVMVAVVAVPIVWKLHRPSILGSTAEALHQILSISNHASLFGLALAAVLRWSLLAGAAVLGVSMIGRSLARDRVVVSCLIALTALELVTLTRGLHPQAPLAEAVPRSSPSLRYLQTHAGHQRVAALGLALAANGAARYGLNDARARDLPLPSRYANLFAGLGGEVAATHGKTELIPRDVAHPKFLTLLRAFGVRFLLDAPSNTRLGGKSGLNLAFSDPHDRIFRVRQTASRAFVAYDWRSTRGRERALTETVASSSTDLERSPVIENLAPSLRAGRRARPVPATVLHDDPDKVVVRATANRPSMLVLLDSYYPGWTATVDGRDSQILPANEAFRAVRISAGDHTVVFRYRPASVRLGVAFTLVALALIIIGLGLVGMGAALRRPQGLDRRGR